MKEKTPENNRSSICKLNHSRTLVLHHTITSPLPQPECNYIHSKKKWECQVQHHLCPDIFDMYKFHPCDWRYKLSGSTRRGTI